MVTYSKLLIVKRMEKLIWKSHSIGKVAVQYDNPYKQAEYAYSQIAEVANE
jgi:Neuraminidase (sialidase)